MRQGALRIGVRYCGYAALLLWMTNFLVACRFGNGRSWEVGIIQGLLTFERGTHATHVCLHCINYHEYADGFELRFNTSGEFELRLLPAYLDLADGFLLAIPFWPAVLGLTIASFVAGRRLRRQMRPGFCAGCGYDLTGNVSGICPECGRPIDSG